MSDLQTKYQKLATEYAKLKSHIPVLKEAVREKQTKENLLREEIKTRDQSIRKYEQEVDSLTFRNQQLSKRVEVLQDDAEEFNKYKKTKYKEEMSLQDGESNHVIEQELSNKIQENEQLHMQMDKKGKEFDMTLMKLRDRVDVLERDNSQHESVLNATVKGHKEKIEKLQEEKAMLEVKLQCQEREVREAKLRAQKAEEQLQYVQSNLGAELAEKTKTLIDKLPFNDTKIRDLNALNVPTHDRQHQLKTKDLMARASSLVHDLVKGLSDFHSYVEQRSRIYPADGKIDPITPINEKLCQYLHDNASYLRPVEQSFKDLQGSLKDDALTTLETAVGLQNFATCFRSYVTYLNKVTPYHLHSIEEECQISTCTQTLANKNMELHSSLSRLTAVFNKLETYVSVLASQSDKTCDHPRSNHSRFFKELSNSLSYLHLILKELSGHYNSKVSLEHQLPTATSKLKTTDEFIINSLVSLTTCASKFTNFIKTNLEFFDSSAGYRTRGSSINSIETLDSLKSNPIVGLYRQKASNYICSLNRPMPESVPYKIAVMNRKTLLSSTESRDSLAQQVSIFQDKTSKLEQEKEHWRLELQLQQMKYDKEVKKVVDLAAKLKTLQISDGSNSTIVTADNITGNDQSLSSIDELSSYEKRSATRTSSVTTDTSMLGSVQTQPYIGSSDLETREDLIKKHFSKRISDLTTQLQLADSKAVSFNAECRALQQRLSLTDKAKETMQNDMRTSNQTIAQLKDELATTTKSYEDQLSMMSEHLAGMNEKLTQQKDEIDDLRHKMNTKGVKKGKK